MHWIPPSVFSCNDFDSIKRTSEEQRVESRESNRVCHNNEPSKHAAGMFHMSVNQSLFYIAPFKVDHHHKVLYKIEHMQRHSHTRTHARTER